MPSNDHIINQMRADALRFYGMGEALDGVTERVAIEACVTRLTATTVECIVRGSDDTPVVMSAEHESQSRRRSDADADKSVRTPPGKCCEFLRSEVIVQYFSAERALVRIPKAYLPAFCLWRYRLTGPQLAEAEALVARHNAPYLKSSPAATERVGNIRI